MKLTHRRDLDCLECPQCGYLREIPRHIIRRPDKYATFKERAESAHVRHRGPKLAPAVMRQTAHDVWRELTGLSW
jgi:hypothetical protein